MPFRRLLSSTLPTQIPRKQQDSRARRSRESGIPTGAAHRASKVTPR